MKFIIYGIHPTALAYTLVAGRYSLRVAISIDVATSLARLGVAPRAIT
jgi:hypothetical protein